MKELAQAKTLYGSRLGVTPSLDAPQYVGFSAAEQEVGLGPNGHARGMTGPVGYRHADALRATRQRLLDAGAAAQRPVRDVGGGKLIATATDADVIGLLQHP